MLRAVLLHGLLLAVSVSWGEILPGYLDFDNLPETNFSCEGKVIGGYYADVETGCQMFHVCTIGQKGEVSDIKFLCLNGTVFDQETRVCERIDEVDCDKSESFFGLNLELYGNTPAQSLSECEGDCEEEEISEEEEEYDDFESSTVLTTTTTKATTTTPTTTTTTTTPAPVTSHFGGSDSEGLAALLALHNAFNQGQRRPPPPTTRRPSININLRTRFTASDTRPEGYSLSRPTFLPPTSSTPLKANYHHFHSGDTHFTHSFDPDTPYRFQYFSQKSSPSPFRRPEVSIVTSTSTSTSVRIANSTLEYDDYPDGVDPFFRDVPKLHRNKRDADHVIKISNETDDKTVFLKSLLNSIDLGDDERQQVVKVFKTAEPEVDLAMEKGVDSVLETLENKLLEMELDGDGGGVAFEYEGDSTREKREVSKIRVRVRKPSKTGVNQKTSTSTALPDIRPVTEEIEDDVTTVEYRRTSAYHKSNRHVTTPHTPSTRLQTRFEYNNTHPKGKRVSTTRRSWSRHTPVREDEIPASSDSQEVRIPHRGEIRSRNVQNAKLNLGSQIIEEAFISPATHKNPSRRPRPNFDNPSLLTHKTSLKSDSVETEAATPLVRNAPRRTYIAQDVGSIIVPSLHPSQVNDMNSDQKTRIRDRSRSTNIDSHFRRNPIPNSTPIRPSFEHQRSQRPIENHPAIYKTADTGETIDPKDVPAYEEDVIISEPRKLSSFQRNENARRKIPPKNSQSRVPNRPVQVLRRRRPNTMHSTVSPIELEQVEEINQQRLPHQLSVKQYRQHETDLPSLSDSLLDHTSTTTTEPPFFSPSDVTIDPDFSCQDKVKGGLYADVHANCKGFFICTQGKDGLEESHFWCGQGTKFNQKSRTCQQSRLVDCARSVRFYYLNNNHFQIHQADIEDKLRGDFEPMRTA